MIEAQSVLYDIKPCDLQQPYIFVSYSSMDSELVWRDVREFQRRGYNVWLDEKNLDKTKLSWREDAIEAIEDMECELVVFYVSSYSLRSDACYQELSKTIDERTQAMHFGPVKFIAVDAEPVGDITAFSQRVFQEIRGSVMQKEERNRQALALDGFMRNFFNSNNEKVRIHPKDEANRKIDYYDDITASFPEITKIYEPKAEAVPEQVISEERHEISEKVTSEEQCQAAEIEDMKEQYREAENETGEEIPRFTKPEGESETNWGSNVLGKKEALRISIQQGILEIPVGYTGIQILLKHSVFWGNSDIQELILPDSMKELNSSEFRSCKNLKTVRLPKFLTKVSPYAFQDCESLTQVVIPGNVTKIDSSAFEGCTSLQSVLLPEELKTLEMAAFKNCSVLQEVYLPPHLEKMGITCFEGCRALTKVTIPGSLKTVSSSAFKECTALRSVMIEEGVEKIEGAFDRCGFEPMHVRIPDSVKKIDSIAFYKSNVIIHCNGGSYAESFAKKRSLPFVLN